MATDAESRVSRGSLSAIFNAPNQGEHPQPILQCLQIKTLETGANGVARYRVVFSDIDNYVQSMLASRKYFY